MGPSWATITGIAANIASLRRFQSLRVGAPGWPGRSEYRDCIGPGAEQAATSLMCPVI